MTLDPLTLLGALALYYLLGFGSCLALRRQIGGGEGDGDAGPPPARRPPPPLCGPGAPSVLTPDDEADAEDWLRLTLSDLNHGAPRPISRSR